MSRCSACGDPFDNLLCAPCSGEYRKIVQAERRAMCHEITVILRLREGQAKGACLALAEILDLFRKGGRFEITEEA